MGCGSGDAELTPRLNRRMTEPISQAKKHPVIFAGYW
jgi:hypothetical protein